MQSSCFLSSKEALHVLWPADVQGCQDSKLQAERIAALQERKQALEALLNTRVGELKQVCLQEAVSSFHFSFQPYQMLVRMKETSFLTPCEESKTVFYSLHMSLTYSDIWIFNISFDRMLTK